MTFRIVHSYFLRFRHIIRQFRHFVFRIDSYETGRSAISLRVAAKTRTKPTGPPPTVYRTNMPLTMAYCRFDSIRYIRDVFARQTPTLLSWPICTSIYLMLCITPLETNTRTLSRPNTDSARPPRWERVGTKPPAATTFTQGLLRNQSLRRYGIFEKQTTKLLSWTIYISIDFMVSTPLTLRTPGRPNRHLKKKRWRFAKRSPNGPMLSYALLKLKLLTLHYVKVDIRTNKPVNDGFRFRLSCSVSIQD